MGLAQYLDHQSRIPVKGPRCTVCALIARLPDEDAEELITAMADPTLTGSTIARALRADGHHMTAQTLNRHRRGDCIHQ